MLPLPTSQLKPFNAFLARSGLKHDRARTMIRLAIACKHAAAAGDDTAEAALAAEFEARARVAALHVVWSGNEPVLFRRSPDDPAVWDKPIYLPREDEWPPSWTKEHAPSIKKPATKSPATPKP